MRAPAWLIAVLLTGCHPSASVENTMPVANLQTYRSVALRVSSSAGSPQTGALQAQVMGLLQQRCGFEHVAAGGTNGDVLVDLNITGAGRGGTGFIKNQSVATLDALLVLTDGGSGELLGTARIHGASSGLIINGAPPENEAIEVVAKAVVDQLAKSGCSGPRVARVDPPPPPPPPPDHTAGSAAPPPPDESHRAEADALNEQGKDKLRGADAAGALAAFQKANALLPDARYAYNICLTLEAQEQWDAATTACKQARGMNPSAKLQASIDHRLDLLAHRQ